MATLPWIWDLQHLHLPDYFTAEERAARDESFGRIAASGRPAVISSETGAADFASRHPEARNRLRVLRFTTVPGGDWTRADPGEVAARYGVAAPFVLLPNQFWVHKNHELAFDAFRRLRDRAVEGTLVCTGTPEDPRRPGHADGLRRWLGEHDLEDRVRILGVVPRADYVGLLRGAAAVLQPSRFEGWSSTVEDARALGRRLLLSDLPVHREQSPAGSRFFGVDDAEALTRLLVEALAENAPAVPEDEALARQGARVREFGRTFVAVAREACA